MYKKLTILFLLLAPAMVMGVGSNDSVLGKRSAENVLSNQPPLKLIKTDNAVENAGALPHRQSVLAPLDDLRSLCRQESPDIFKSDMATSSSYVTSLHLSNPPTISTKLCPHSDLLPQSYINEELETDDRNQEKQLIRDRYFCPECFVNLINIRNIKRIKHHKFCRNQGFEHKTALTINTPIVINHMSGDIYSLHPTKGAIYLQNSNGLDENKIIPNADESFTYEDLESGIIRHWNKLGFDVGTHERFANIVESDFEIISRKPEDEIKEYYECPNPYCDSLQYNKDYETLVKHLREVHKSKNSYACHYDNCEVLYRCPAALFHCHEIKHLGIEFVCPYCDDSLTRKDHLKNSHIKKYHPEHYT